MNYIPGFSNYLEASVPEYGPAPIMDAEPVVPQRAMVEPATQEAAPMDYGALAGLDLSGLNNLYGMNFGTDFGGGAMGGIYPDDPNTEYIAAPLSNRGNFTAQSGNAFVMGADQPVRLVDLNTNTVIFEGTGYDAAREATRLGQNLSDTMGRKAAYDIQTADPSGVYVTVANEKKNKSTLGTIAQVAGTLAPLAMIPLTMGLSAPLAGITTAGKVALGAGLGGLGSALKGDNVLKGAAMGGLSAAGGGYLGKTLGSVGNIGLRAGTAIGTGLGSTAGGLVTGQSLKNSLLGGVASGALSYVTPDIVKGLGINQGAPVSSNTSADTSTSTGADAGAGGFDGINVVGRSLTPSFSTTNVNLGGFKTPTQKYLRDAEADDVINPETRTPYNTGYDGDIIKVTGSVPGAVTGGLNLDRFIADPAADRGDEDIIKVTGRRTIPGEVTGGFTGNAAVDRLLPPETSELGDEDIIKVTGQRPGAVTGGLNLSALTSTVPAVSPNDIVVNATTKTTPSAVTGGLTLSPDTVTDIDQKSEAERKAEEERKKLGLEEYLRIAGLLSGLVGGGGGGGSGSSGTYGGGGTGRLNPIFSAKLPSAGGFGVNRTARPMGDVDWLTYGTRPELNFFDYAARNNPAPITTPIPNNPAGPIMNQKDPMQFAKGGRSQFAVNGAGTGRSDDIPAVLSDGEYVIDAETVALLGDGSNKAGAKKLDELRVKVRKHKGQKLAKGRFSANAKKPEAYLSGGRI
jgi:hypothetical protein